jgi:hypothetical protein
MPLRKNARRAFKDARVVALFRSATSRPGYQVDHGFSAVVAVAGSDAPRKIRKICVRGLACPCQLLRTQRPWQRLALLVVLALLVGVNLLPVAAQTREPPLLPGPGQRSAAVQVGRRRTGDR